LARVAFGGVLAVLGGAFILIWIGRLFLPGGLQAALANPLDTLGVLALAGFFLVVGWLAAFWRRSIVIDEAQAELWVVQDVRIYRRAKRYPLKSFFRLVFLTEQAGDPPALFYSLRLVQPDKQWVLLASSSSIQEIQELGGRLGELLKMDVVELSQRQWEGVVGKKKRLGRG